MNSRTLELAEIRRTAEIMASRKFNSKIWQYEYENGAAIRVYPGVRFTLIRAGQQSIQSSDFNKLERMACEWRPEESGSGKYVCRDCGIPDFDGAICRECGGHDFSEGDES